MKQILLATALIALPVVGFSAFQMYLAAPAAVAATTPAATDPLGDLSAMKKIISDVETIAATGDMAAAEKRITDFETAWDDAAATLRAMDSNAWGNVDQAADDALGALRASQPVAADVTATLAALATSLDNPGNAAGTAPAGGVTMVSGIAVTDAAGRALPCEVMLKAVADGLATTAIAAADKVAAIDFQTKGLERCNADDDARADGFSAQALALLAAK
ncbi:MAG: hypothetical protein ORN49_12265 [Rhodobacteraceae bacterium]|nr:hypothetical protein [Paracoccaceae bacterium]